MMGTHNLVAAAGPDSYIEVIAKDPAAEPPDRPRWFSLDDEIVELRLAASPRPLAWVLSTDDLDAAIESAAALGISLGRPLSMSRDDLHWRVAVRDDGQLDLGGAVPLVVEWPPGTHPASRMPDLGLRIREISILTESAARLSALLDAFDLAARPEIAVPETRQTESLPEISVTLSVPGGQIITLT